MKDCRKYHKWLTSKEQGANPTIAEDDTAGERDSVMFSIYTGFAETD